MVLPTHNSSRANTDHEKQQQRRSEKLGRIMSYGISSLISALIFASLSMGKTSIQFQQQRQMKQQEQQKRSGDDDSGDRAATDILKPNHAHASNVLAHVEALNDAMIPGRGYQPTPARYNSELPEAKGSYWWLNNCGSVNVPEAFGIAALNMTYPREYFMAGHPATKGYSTDMYMKYIARYASLLLQRQPTSLVEFGNGGGVFAETFFKTYGKNFVTVEGSGAGCELTIEQHGVPKEQVVQHDLRHPVFLGRRFDVAVCTEVVEHVEPPFASQIVLNLVLHSDIIWFSYMPVGLENGAWINHPNERPFELWRNLFDFYGYDVVRFDGRLVEATYYRGEFIAYKRNNGGRLKPITEEDLAAHLDSDVLDRKEQ